MSKKATREEVHKLFKGFLMAVNKDRNKSYKRLHSVRGKDATGRNFITLLKEHYNLKDNKEAFEIIDAYLNKYPVKGGYLLSIPTDKQKKKQEKKKERPIDYYLKLVNTE